MLAAGVHDVGAGVRGRVGMPGIIVPSRLWPLDPIALPARNQWLGRHEDLLVVTHKELPAPADSRPAFPASVGAQAD